MTTDAPLIEFNHVAKSFENQTAISDLNFKIQTGEIFVLVGPSGSGKTTTLKMINKLIAPSDGEISFQNQPLTSYNTQKLRWQIGYVLQQIALFPNMTVAQNITLIPEMKGVDRHTARQAAETLLDEVDLDPKIYCDRKPNELSGGEQQRIGILRAIASKPPLVLMDEPFSALDPLSRQQLQDLVLKLHQRAHNTIVFVTHDMNEAMKLGDRIAVMHLGKIEQLDTPANIAQNPASDFVASFFANTAAQNVLTEPVSVLLDKCRPLKPGEKPAQVIRFDSSMDSLITALNQGEPIALAGNHQIKGVIDRQTVLTYLQHQLKV